MQRTDKVICSDRFELHRHKKSFTGNKNLGLPYEKAIMEVILTFLRSRTGALQILAFTTLRPMTVSYNKIYSL